MTSEIELSCALLPFPFTVLTSSLFASPAATILSTPLFSEYHAEVESLIYEGGFQILQYLIDLIYLLCLRTVEQLVDKVGD